MIEVEARKALELLGMANYQLYQMEIQMQDLIGRYNQINDENQKLKQENNEIKSRLYVLESTIEPMPGFPKIIHADRDGNMLEES